MKLHRFLVLLFSGYAFCSVLSHVRLVDHASYMIDVITRTFNIVEERGWSNLKLPDHVQVFNQTFLTSTISGKVNYINGFLVSIQHMDILHSTLHQAWSFNSALQKPMVTVRGTLSMHNVAVGFDVIADLHGHTNKYRFTTIYVHPLISFAFSIIKDINEDTLEVTVVGTVPRTTRMPAFRPLNGTSDILATTFDPTATTSAGIHAWGPEILKPIVHEVVTKKVPFPTICYNCSP